MTTTTQATPDHPHDNPDMHVSFNDWLDYMAEEFPTIDAMRFYETREIVDKVEPEPEATNSSMTAEDYQQQFQATEEDVAGMSLWELLSQGSDVASNVVLAKLEELGIPPEAALLVAGVLGKNPKNIVKGGKGMLHTPKMKKTKNEPFKTSKSGEVVGKPTKGGPGVAVGKPSPASQVPSKHVKYPLAPTKETRRLGLTRKNEKIAAGGLTTGVVLNRMLQGDRDVDGTLKVATKPEVVTPEASENQFGYHKREGQNFWTVDNDDSYWDTHDIEGSSAFEEAPLKQQPQQELDWDFWFK